MDLGETKESRDENSNMKAGTWPTWEVKHKTKHVANILFSDSSERFKSAQPVVRAKTPIVRVKDRITGIRCDLNACTRMGVVNSAWVRLCTDWHPTIRHLLLVVKVFSMRHGLTGSGRGDHLTSYCLTVLVIFFLQTKSILHPVTVLQEVSDLPELQIMGYNFSFCRDQALLPPLQQCSHIGPHLGTLVPMGTKMRFLVPILFQSPHFPHFRLKNASKVSAATIYRLDVNHLITCDKQMYSQNFIANTDALKP